MTTLTIKEQLDSVQLERPARTLRKVFMVHRSTRQVRQYVVVSRAVRDRIEAMLDSGKWVLVENDGTTAEWIETRIVIAVQGRGVAPAEHYDWNGDKIRYRRFRCRKDGVTGRVRERVLGDLWVAAREAVNVNA